MGFLRRNLHSCPEKLKETAYIGEIGPGVRSHHYGRFSSVTSMLHGLARLEGP